MPTHKNSSQFFQLTLELESWLLAAADKPTTPLKKTDFSAIREKVCAKIWNALLGEVQIRLSKKFL